MHQNQVYHRAGILLMAASFVDGELAERLVAEAQATLSCTPRTASIGVAVLVDDEEARRERSFLRFMQRRGRPVSRRDVQLHLSGALKAIEISNLLEGLRQKGSIVEIQRPRQDGPGRPLASPHYALT